jgi:hypothetical protein
VSFVGATRIAGTGALVALAMACGAAAQGAQSSDPMKCERDPTCTKARAGYRDCSFQCQDDPECMDRCRGADPDGLGHPQ